MEDTKNVKNENRSYGETPAVNYAIFYCPICLRLDSYTGCDFGCRYCFSNDWLKKMYNSMSVHWIRHGALKNLQEWKDRAGRRSPPTQNVLKESRTFRLCLLTG